MKPEISTILIFALVWCLLHFFILLCRLPFSEEKVGRLKQYTKGLAFVSGSILVGFIGHAVSDNHSAIDKTIETFPQFFQILATLAVVASVLLWFVIMFTLVVGHAATMWFSWMLSDHEIWSEAH